MSKCPDGCIPVKDALSAVDYLTQDMAKANKAFARKELKSLLTALSDSEEFVEIEMLKHFLTGFKEAVETGDASNLVTPRGLRVKKIVDVEEFVESNFFLGMRGKVWPSVMEDLYNIFHGPDSDFISEVVLGGAVGTGKSVRAELGLAYLLYIQSCYHSPQAEHDLAPGTSIYFVFQSISLSLAKKVLFEQFSQRLRRSPYFQKYFPFNKDITTMLKFPNDVNIMPIASGDTSALGLAVIAGAIDECNFQARVVNSSRARFTGEAEYDAADKLYTTLSRRLKSRFSKAGKMPGKLFLMSSANYPDDFIDRKMKEAEELKRIGEKSHIYVSARALWEAKPPGTFSDKMFPVEVGDATRRSRIIESVDDAADPGSVIWVPEDFRRDFHSDTEASIRDLAGIPVGSSSAFLKQREKIHEAAQAHVKTFGGKSLFKNESIDLSFFSQNVGVLLSDEYLDAWGDELAEYYCHLDLALSGDSCGISIGHLGGFKEVGKAFEYDEGERKYKEAKAGKKPVILIDGVMEIRPPQADEIDLNILGDFLQAISQRINLVYVTADSFQSAAVLQRIRKSFNVKGRRIKSAILSVDRSMAAYAEVKQALRDDRILYPDVEKLQVELRELQFDPKKEKVDHPVGGGKDLSDSLAGVCYLISTVGTNARTMNSNGGGTNAFRRIRSGRRQAR